MDSKVSAFLDRLNDSASIEEFQTVLVEIAESHGYDFYLIASIPRPVAVPKDSLMLTNIGDDWVYHYVTNGYIDHDPVIPRMIKSDMPFEWRDMNKDKPLGKKAQKVMDEAHRIGQLASGFCIPIHGAMGAQEGISFAGKNNIKLNEQQRRSLHILGIYAVSRIKELLDQPKSSDLPSLAKREIECLKWASSGKTSWETAEILGISVTTVDSYLNSAMKKLGATNRVQAVAEALRLKLMN